MSAGAPEPADALGARLRELLVFGLLQALGLPPTPSNRAAAEAAVERTAGRLLEFERRNVAGQLPAAAGWLAAQWAPPPTVRGAEGVPSQGPTLVFANHVGFLDGALVVSQLGRADLLAVTEGQQPLHSLPSLEGALLSVRGQAPAPRALEALRAGRCVLVFPGAALEPEPAFGAAWLERWQPGLLGFAALVPGLAVVPALLHGVCPAWAAGQGGAPTLLGGWLTWLTAWHPALRPRLRFGAPLSAADLLGDRPALDVVREAMRALLRAEGLDAGR